MTGARATSSTIEAAATANGRAGTVALDTIGIAALGSSQRQAHRGASLGSGEGKTQWMPTRRSCWSMITI
jgi:hypothetical protein